MPVHIAILTKRVNSKMCFNEMPRSCPLQTPFQVGTLRCCRAAGGGRGLVASEIWNPPFHDRKFTQCCRYVRQARNIGNGKIQTRWQMENNEVMWDAMSLLQAVGIYYHLGMVQAGSFRLGWANTPRRTWMKLWDAFNGGSGTVVSIWGRGSVLNLHTA